MHEFKCLTFSFGLYGDFDKTKNLNMDEHLIFSQSKKNSGINANEWIHSKLNLNLVSKIISSKQAVKDVLGKICETMT